MLKLLPYFEASKSINIKLQMRRLNLYSIIQLEDVYYYEREKVLILYRKISQLYDVGKLNFSNEFNMNSRYLEDNQHLTKEQLINIIIIFLHTKYLINHYLNALKEI